MQHFLDRASMSFAAAALVALVSSVAIWAAGAYYLTARLGIGIAPALAPDWLYPRIVWGGLWGFSFILPLMRGHWWLRGIILSLSPTAFQLLYVFPREAGTGFFGALTSASGRRRSCSRPTRFGGSRRRGCCARPAMHDLV